MSLDITVEAVCQFITDHGGKVKNTVLVSHFKKVLNNPETKDSARQKFKECVNTVAVVKTENGEKYVQLKKKYRSSLSAASSASEISGDGVPPLTPPADSTNSPSKSINEPKSSHEMSFTSPEEMPYADESEHSTHSSSRTSKHDRSSSPASHNGEHKSKKSSQHQLSPKQKATSSQPTEPKELSPSKHRKDPSHKLETTHASMSAPVEAPQGAAASPKKQTSPRKQSRAGQSETTRTAEEKTAPAAKSQPHVDNSTFTAPSSVLMRKKKERKENVPPSPNLDHRMSSLERVKASLQNAPAEQRIARTRPVSVMQGSYVGSVERVRQNFQNKQRLNEDSASLALSEKSLDSKGEEQDYDEERPLPNVVLDINEKAWIIQSSKGSLVEMRKLLNVDQTLADRKDFVLVS
ncbi:unnamed protein product [Clavelina lepadiformis]|uniref:SOWAHA-C winged helix-turn-helix domain-containing protein n=1 Tax=Clavelina lepadiformis TaxID=159417 RepID=A0ABP0FVR9_CLALP